MTEMMRMRTGMTKIDDITEIVYDLQRDNVVASLQRNTIKVGKTFQLIYTQLMILKKSIGDLPDEEWDD